MKNGIVQHLELHLGKMAGGWGDSGAIQVAQFLDRPQVGTTTYVTLGMSDTALPMAGRSVRQELLMPRSTRRASLHF